MLNHPRREDVIASTARARVNDQIRISPIRLIDADGSQRGIVPLDIAKQTAQENGLDLVEVAPKARPPVVRIMDHGKHLYEQQKRSKEAKKRQHTVDVKELKFRPEIGDHDLDFKMRRAAKFLKKGQKVKITVRFRFRELRRPELGHRVLDSVVDRLGGMADVETRARSVEGRQLVMMLAPKAAEA